jgi:hypothetical protein
MGAKLLRRKVLSISLCCIAKNKASESDLHSILVPCQQVLLTPTIAAWE